MRWAWHQRLLAIVAVLLLGLVLAPGSARAATCKQTDPIDRKYCQLGGSSSVLGAPVGAGYKVANGRARNYRSGMILWSSATGAHEVHGAILTRYRATGSAAGFLGFPTTDESTTPDRVGRFNHFAKSGSIYWTPPTGAHDVRGDIRTRWASMGWERSSLGYPVSDEYAVTGGRESDFQDGFLHWNAANRGIRLALGTVLAPGVAHRSYTDPAGPFALHVVTLDPAGRGTIDTALAQDQLAGTATPSSMGAAHHALIAVNGDYFLASGRPVHLYAEDGSLVQAPMLVENELGSTGVGVNATLGEPSISMRLGVVRSGASAMVARLNDGAPASDELAIYTPKGADLETAPSDACTASLRLAGSPSRAADHTSQQPLTVDAVSCGASPSSTPGDWAVSAPLGGAYEPMVRGLRPGDDLTFNWSVGWPGVFDALGGAPLLVANGQILAPDGTDPFLARNPRTGIGVGADGVVHIVTVDGRSGGSAGMTLREFAQYLQQLGATWALNLDGGGSTTMAVDGKTVNRPSDGVERPTANALLVLNGPDSSSPAAQPQLTGPATPDTRQAWQREAHDPASTGGLATSLQRRGLPLTPELQEVAADFSRR